MKFSKRILKDNRVYHSPDGELKVDGDSKRHWAENIQKLLSKRFDIPVFWDHQADPSKAQPIARKGNKRRRAKGQAGWLTNAHVADDGSLELEFDIPRAADADRVKSNITKVSPVVWSSLKDGEGEQHENVIGACDLVVHPVDTTQEDFQPLLDAAVHASLWRFSSDGTCHAYKLADDESDDFDMDDETEPDETTASDDAARLKNVIQSLEKLGVVLAGDTDTSNFFERVESALLTAAAHTEDGADEMEETKPEVAQLSLEHNKLQKYAEQQHRKQIKTALSLLLDSGQCSPEEFKVREATLSAVQLSLDDDGNQRQSALEAWIESRAAVPAGTFWDDKKRTAMSGLQETRQPPEVTDGALSEEEADALADQILRRR